MEDFLPVAWIVEAQVPQARTGKTFEEEMSVRTLSTYLLQIFCKINLDSKVIVKSTLGPNNNLWRNSYLWPE